VDDEDRRAIAAWDRLKGISEPRHSGTTLHDIPTADERYLSDTAPLMRVTRPRTCNCGSCTKCRHREDARRWQRKKRRLRSERAVHSGG
jgi:hypothetical protein